MSTAVNSDGGYLVDPQTSPTRSKPVLHSTASIRCDCQSVVNVEATSYDVLFDHTAEVGAGWADETSAAAETGTPSNIERITIPLHELSCFAQGVSASAG